MKLGEGPEPTRWPTTPVAPADASFFVALLHTQWVLLAKRLGPVAVSGLLLFVACDAIDASAAQQEAEKKQGVIKPQHLPPSDPGPSPW